jgi:hypothetical protein
MTGVVLRCPNCGAVQSGREACQTCHAAQVRDFCTNHDPGRWLDGPACADCGARFGDLAQPAALRDESLAPASAPARSANDPVLSALQRRLDAHELLLRALLTHLAMTDAQAFGGAIGGIVRSRTVPDEVAQEVTILVEEIAASLR